MRPRVGNCSYEVPLGEGLDISEPENFLTERLTRFTDGVFDEEKGEMCCFANTPGKWHVQIAIDPEEPDSFFSYDNTVHDTGVVVDVTGDAVTDVRFEQILITVQGRVSCLNQTACRNATITVEDYYHVQSSKPFSSYERSTTIDDEYWFRFERIPPMTIIRSIEPEDSRRHYIWEDGQDGQQIHPLETKPGWPILIYSTV